MKIFIIDDKDGGRVEAAIDDSKVLKFAVLLENSGHVKSFYIDGLNVTNHQKLFDCKGYNKWINVMN